MIYPWSPVMRHNEVMPCTLQLLTIPIMSTTDTGRSYHRSCTGLAQETVTKHPSSGTQDIMLFGSCFCPFVQRVWVALEYLEIPYNVRAISS